MSDALGANPADIHTRDTPHDQLPTNPIPLPDLDLDNPAFHPDHGPTVVGDRPCTTCGYNLSGLPISGNCPECGKPVRLSLLGELLQFASPEYVKSIDSGLKLIIEAIGVYFIILVAGIAIRLGLPNIRPSMNVNGVDLIAQSLTILPSAIFILGYWRYTTPDPGFTGREKPTSARTIARISACVQPAAKLGVLIIKLLGAFTPGGGTLGSTLLDILGVLFYLVDLAAFATLFFAITLYTRWIAFRIPDPDIIKQTRLNIWLLPILQTVGAIFCGLGPLIALIRYLMMHLAVRRRVQQTLRFQAIHTFAHNVMPPPLPRRDPFP